MGLRVQVSGFAPISEWSTLMDKSSFQGITLSNESVIFFIKLDFFINLEYNIYVR